MGVLKVRQLHMALALGVALVLGACASRTPVRGAPVESLGTSAGEATVPAGAPVEAVRPPDPNAGKPGYYTVKPGDTLIRIGLDSGQNWRDIARWNAMDNPNLIEVGQVLRVVPPGTSATAETGVVARPVAPASGVAAAPLAPATAVSAAKPASAAVPASPPVATASAPAPVVAPAPTPPAASAGGDDEMAFIWPAAGAMINGFDEARNKGVDLAGRPGDAVLAAADGKVVYAGAGLRGYGNLIILKHNNTYLTAYAHNQALLVKEDQTVRKGQKVAEMGNSDADRVKLHFEIRRQGKPVDPMKYLPPRPAP
jgi:lipoprotein NlpD